MLCFICNTHPYFALFSTNNLPCLLLVEGRQYKGHLCTARPFINYFVFSDKMETVSSFIWSVLYPTFTDRISAIFDDISETGEGFSWYGNGDTACAVTSHVSPQFFHHSNKPYRSRATLHASGLEPAFAEAYTCGLQKQCTVWNNLGGRK